MSRVFAIVASWILILVALLALLESAFLYYAPMIFPLPALEKSGAGATVFLQTSKSGIYPHRYVALFGDSYAYGQGDWLLENEHTLRPAYQAAHLLHARTGMDVVTFGRPASDSLTANLVWPNFFLGSAEKMRGKPVEKPDTILVYFYEGNDLNDNVEVVEKLVYPSLPEHDRFFDETFFQEKIIPDFERINPYLTALNSFGRLDGLFFVNLTTGLFGEVIDRMQKGKSRPPWKQRERGSVTRILINGREDYLPDHIQSPALNLSSEQIDVGLYVFEQSLVAVRSRFPDSKIGVVYIPSVVTPYEVISDKISDYYRERDQSSPSLRQAGMIRERSDRICRGSRAIAQKHQVGFIDTRPRMRGLAKHTYLHGPIDWNHFNQKGYEALSIDLEILVNQLRESPDAAVGICNFGESSILR